MTAPAPRPLIGLPSDVKTDGDMPFHAVGEKYLTAVTDGAHGLPVAIPSLGSRIDIDALLERLDGLLLTGSPSNVEPHRYDGPESAPGTAHDAARDETTLPLIERALAVGIPCLFVCRGLQELNVVMGGTLHQRIEELPDYLNHQADKSLPLDERYGPAHEVALTDGGALIAMNDGVPKLMVNSLHSQGIDRIGTGLSIEAVAPDGFIEAVSVDGHPTFGLGVQWHPEWKVTESGFGMRLFESFGKACESWAAARGRPRRSSAGNQAA